MHFDDDLLAADERQSFARQEQVRFRRCQSFFCHESTPRKLISSCVPLKTTFDIMSYGFKSARRYSDAGTNILDFIHNSKSPALRTISGFCCQLQNEDAEYWRPLRSLGPWCEQVYVSASTPVWVEIGQIFARLVEPFRAWPWRFGLLLGDELDEHGKRVLALEALGLCEHVDAITREILKGVDSVDEIVSPLFLQKLSDMFNKVSVTNIVSEAAFAGSHTRRATDHGRHCCPSTLASNHILSAAKTELRVALDLVFSCAL